MTEEKTKAEESVNNNSTEKGKRFKDIQEDKPNLKLSELKKALLKHGDLKMQNIPYSP